MELSIDVVTGIVISASLWLVTGQQQPKLKNCTTVMDVIDPCGCKLGTDTIDFICASNGHTYFSMCFFNCQKALMNSKIRVAHEGVCGEDSKCACQAGYKPLCATNGVTYPNECVLNCFMRKDSTIRLEHTGACGSGGEQALTDQVEPENQNNKPGYCYCHWNLRRLRARFGNNGKRYARSSCGCGCRHERKTEASLKPPPAKLTAQPPSCPFNNPPPIQLRTRDAEKKIKKKKCVCIMLHRPLCSNHNQTYFNYCVLDCIAKNNQSVEFQHWGRCGSPQEIPYPLPKKKEDPKS